MPIQRMLGQGDEWRIEAELSIDGSIMSIVRISALAGG